MVTRRCFRAKASSWRWTGFGTKGCVTSPCLCPCGGRSNRGLRRPSQVRPPECAAVTPSHWEGNATVHFRNPCQVTGGFSIVALLCRMKHFDLCELGRFRAVVTVLQMRLIAHICSKVLHKNQWVALVALVDVPWLSESSWVTDAWLQSDLLVCTQISDLSQAGFFFFFDWCVDLRDFVVFLFEKTNYT